MGTISPILQAFLKTIIEIPRKVLGKLVSTKQIKCPFFSFIFSVVAIVIAVLHMCMSSSCSIVKWAFALGLFSTICLDLKSGGSGSGVVRTDGNFRASD